MKKENKYKIIIGVMIGVLLFVTYLGGYYSREMNKLNERIYPNVDKIESGFTLFDVMTNVTLEEQGDVENGDG